MSLRRMRRQKPRMLVENVKVQNFKSFKDINVQLRDFNVLIGANASGKSNFTEIFNFLKHLATSGLDDAISLQGGLEYLQNFNNRSEQNLFFEITLGSTAHEIEFFVDVTAPYKLYISKAIYRFKIKFTGQMEFKIIEDVWLLHLDVCRCSDANQYEKQSDGQATVTNVDDKLKLDIDLPDYVQINTDAANFLVRKIKPNSLLIENVLVARIVLDGIADIFFDTEVYDFDPKLAKRAIPIKETGKLKNDGSNLTTALKKVIEYDEGQRQFTNLLVNLLPFVDSISTKKFVDRSILFTIKERYFKEQSLPSTLVSDGTVNIVGLILALYFQFSQLTIIEEPERNIHPSLISQIVANMKEASHKRQVIVTTHNPEIIQYADRDSILTIRRDDDGNSEVVRPNDQEDVKNFLENDMDIKELYVQNLLGD